jgi:hypothetical protein
MNLAIRLVTRRRLVGTVTLAGLALLQLLLSTDAAHATQTIPY